jgi:hypothetical protein
MLSRMKLRDGDICHCLLGIGFVRKRRPYGCIKPRCLVCHCDKDLEPNARTRTAPRSTRS